jgi:hypothetical protein
MATTLPRPRPDRRVLAGLLFAGWSVIVLAAYFSYHPLPMRDGVPVWKGLLTVFCMLAISWPLWRQADPRRGFQVEHLLLLPIILTAALVMLPAQYDTPVITVGATVLWLVWVPAAFLLRRYSGPTGFLLALLIWFPGQFTLTNLTLVLLLVAMVAGLTLLLWIKRKHSGEPHRYVQRTIIIALIIGVLLSLADIQRRYAPIGYLTGIVDEQTWLAHNCIEDPQKRGDWTLR